jgi:hypothetical protein
VPEWIRGPDEYEGTFYADPYQTRHHRYEGTSALFGI